jgi:hypothetical protein
MTDIKTRLREGRTDGSNLRWTVGEIHIEAADTIASLERRVEELEGEVKQGAMELEEPAKIVAGNGFPGIGRIFSDAVFRARRTLSKGTGQ